jgi:hypothetical protein
MAISMSEAGDFPSLLGEGLLRRLLARALTRALAKLLG